ncbi:MAG: AbrB/MazE/SpoVT family DNA-binding domain-containing protein [Saprospiraceae bacterium]
MKIKVRKIGNSRGITLPKAIIEHYNFGEEVEVVTQENGVLILPGKVCPREIWGKQLQAVIQSKQKSEKPLLGEFTNKFDEEEWTW